MPLLSDERAGILLAINPTDTVFQVRDVREQLSLKIKKRNAWRPFLADGPCECVANCGISQRPFYFPSLAYQKDGSYWIAAVDGGLCRYRDGIWKHFTKAELGITYDVASLMVDSLHRKWMVDRIYSGGFGGDGLRVLNDINPKLTNIIAFTACSPTYALTLQDSTTTIGRGIRALQLRIPGVDTLTASTAGARFAVRFPGSGTYRLQYWAFDSNGSRNHIERSLTVIAPGPPRILAQATGPLCRPTTLRAQAPPAATLRWLLPSGDTATGSAITARQPGRYILQARSQGCLLADTIAFTSQDTLRLPLAAFTLPSGAPPAPLDTTAPLQPGTPLLLRAPTLTSTGQALTWQRWQPDGTAGAGPQERYYLQGLTGPVMALGILQPDSCPALARFAPRPAEALSVYNIITADGNGQNDFFTATGTGTQAELLIYSRWGRPVFAGTYQPRAWPDDTTPAGLYFYHLQVGDKVAKGWVEVLR